MSPFCGSAVSLGTGVIVRCARLWARAARLPAAANSPACRSAHRQPGEYRFFRATGDERREPVFHARRAPREKPWRWTHADFFEPLQGEPKSSGAALRARWNAAKRVNRNGPGERSRVVEHRHGPFGSDHADQPRHGAIAAAPAGGRPLVGAGIPDMVFIPTCKL